MSLQKLTINEIDPHGNWLYRVGGISALLVGVAYIVIIALYVPVGAPPSDVEARLTYLSSSTALWWTILGLSVLTDFLFIPVALALYLALKDINKNAILLAAIFVGLFVLLDLTITWTNYATLISVSTRFTAAANDEQKAIFLAAATYPAMILESGLLFVYNTLTLSIGIFITGLVILHGIFSKTTAYLGLGTGILGFVAVVGSFFISAFGLAVILASVLTTLWVMLTGFRLYRLGQK